MKITTKTTHWLRRRALDLGVSAAVLAWVLACAKKKAAPPPQPVSVPASMGTVTHRQLDEPSAAGGSQPATAPTQNTTRPTSRSSSLEDAKRTFARKNYRQSATLARQALDAGLPDATTRATALDIAVAGSTLSGDHAGAVALKPQIEVALNSDIDWKTKVRLLAWLEQAQFASEDHAGAAESAQRRIQLLEEKEGSATETAINAHRSLAVYLRESGDRKAARKEFSAVIQAAEQHVGKTHWIAVMSRVGLGQTLVADRKFSAAADELNRARSILPRVEDGPEKSRAEAALYLMLGEAQLGLKKKALAAESLETSIALYKKMRTTEETTSGQAYIEKHLKRAEAALTKTR